MNVYCFSHALGMCHHSFVITIAIYTSNTDDRSVCLIIERSATLRFSPEKTFIGDSLAACFITAHLVYPAGNPVYGKDASD